MATSQHGRFTWYDIASDNLQDALAFYTTVIGWGTHELNDSDIRYMMFTAGETALGGAFEMREGMGGGPRWLPYIATDNLAQTLERVRELGGKVQREPQQAGAAGIWTMVEDPQGAEFCVWQYTTPDVPPLKQGVGHFSWHELATHDYRAALAFYADLFGWQAQNEFDMGEAGMYQIFGLGEMLGGVYNQAPDRPTRPAWLCYIQVADINGTWDKALANGATELIAPMEVPGGSQVAVLLDPQGAAFGLHEQNA